MTELLVLEFQTIVRLLSGILSELSVCATATTASSLMELELLDQMVVVSNEAFDFLSFRFHA